MSRSRKLARFSDNQRSRNVIEQGKALYESIKGNWRFFFENDHEIVAELACGRGEYTICLAEKFPNKNFIGIDVKGDRIWKGSRHASVNHLNNVAFLRTDIFFIDNFFEDSEVNEIWLTFPDPRPRRKDEKHRLSHPSYMMKYQKILKKDGWFRLKTDSTLLFEYTLQVLTDFSIRDHAYTFDLYRSDFVGEHYGIRTKYEKIWVDKGEAIKYMRFRF